MAKQSIKALLGLLFALGYTNAKDSAAKQWKDKNCHPKFPNLSVGDVNITSEAQFEAFKKENEVFIIGISDS